MNVSTKASKATKKPKATIPLDRVRHAWTRASDFSADKESVYPEHAKAQEFDLVRGKRVLEYGCGGGSDAMSYLRRGCEVTYVDIVPSNVEAAGARIAAAGLTEHAQGLVIEESDRIPVDSGTFDVVSAHGVLHHIEHPLLVLKEFFRVLKPRGVLYVMLYTESLWERGRPTIDALTRSGKMGELEAFGCFTDGDGTPYARHYTEADGKALLAEAGFKVRDEVVEYNKGDFRTFVAVAP